MEMGTPATHTADLGADTAWVSTLLPGDQSGSPVHERAQEPPKGRLSEKGDTRSGAPGTLPAPPLSQGGDPQLHVLSLPSEAEKGCSRIHP